MEPSTLQVSTASSVFIVSWRKTRPYYRSQQDESVFLSLGRNHILLCPFPESGGVCELLLFGLFPTNTISYLVPWSAEYTSNSFLCSSWSLCLRSPPLSVHPEEWSRPPFSFFLIFVLEDFPSLGKHVLKLAPPLALGAVFIKLRRRHCFGLKIASLLTFSPTEFPKAEGKASASAFTVHLPSRLCFSCSRAATLVNHPRDWG